MLIELPSTRIHDQIHLRQIVYPVNSVVTFVPLQSVPILFFHLDFLRFLLLHILLTLLLVSDASNQIHLNSTEPVWERSDERFNLSSELGPTY